VDQIKKHYFFYGVDWNTIRQIDAPFVPHLRSVTDTSYFPTEDLDQAPDDAPVDPGAAARDVAFLGSVKIHLDITQNNITTLTGTHSNVLQFRSHSWVICNM